MENTSAKALILAALMVASSVSAVVFSPSPDAEVQRATIGLETIVPTRFGDWQLDETMVPVLPPPDVEAKVKQIYDEILARTYIDRTGERVMLSIAYGGDQTGRLRVHRPESCYSGQGFLVRKVDEQILTLGDRRVPVKRLHASLGTRQEPITYWIRVGDESVSGWASQRFVQLKYGLTGDVPDGLIFRVSSIGRDTGREFQLQERFLNDLFGGLSPKQKSSLVGAGSEQSRG
jgi:EpsI family protein